jgi:hypothetical protein
MFASMEQPRFDDAIRDYLRQTGVLSVLTHDQAAVLDTALNAIGDLHQAYPHPFLGDASPESCRQWLRRLLEIFDDFGFSGGLDDLETSSLQQFSIIWSWWVMANRLARAMLCLAEAGLAEECFPLARSMVEFALWAVALSRDDGPLLATVLRKSDDENAYTVRLAAGGPLEMPDEVLELVRLVPRAGGEGSDADSFARICMKLGVGSTILVAWRIWTSLCHPVATPAYLTTLLSTERVEFRKELFVPGMQPTAIADEMVTLAIQCLLWAGLAVDRLMKDHSLRAALRVIADEAHVSDIGERP